MAGERQGNTLQATALVNEAYLKLVDVRRMNWQNRTHFLAVAATLMRRILVDRARGKLYQKRGGGAPMEPLPDEWAADLPGRDLTALDDALEALMKIDPRKSQIVEMKFFGGMTVDEMAEVLQVSPDTVMREWRLAKVWLFREIRGTAPKPGMRHDEGTTGE